MELPKSPAKPPVKKAPKPKAGQALRIPAIVTAHSKFIVTDKLLMLEG